MTTAHRRRFVRNCLGGFLVTGAGCASRQDTSGGDIFLCGVEVSNNDGEEHDLSLTIHHDGKSIFNQSLSLAAMKHHTQGGGDIDHDWPDDSGAYTVSASLANGQKNHWNLSGKYSYPEAISIDIQIMKDGSLELWFSKSACDKK